MARTEKTMTRENWLHAALAALVDGGVEAVRVEPLAAWLGVTKGSFYWHFKDRPALLAGLLDHWEANFTRGLIDEVSVLPDAADRMRALARIAIETDAGGLDNARAEMAMLAWAARDEQAAERQRQIDRIRIGYLESELKDLAVPQPALHARTIYHALIGTYATRVYDPDAASDDAFLTLVDLILDSRP